MYTTVLHNLQSTQFYTNVRNKIFMLKVRKGKQSEVTQSSDSVTPWTVAYQAPPSMGFSRRGTGVGCHRTLRSREIKIKYPLLTVTGKPRLKQVFWV